MKAAVCYQFGEPLVVEEVQIDPPQRGEVKVRIAAAAVCQGDIGLVRGEHGGETPVIAGHEAAGVVEEVGQSVTGVRPGDNVVVSLLRSCGRCFYCTIGRPNLCEGEFALGRESRLRNGRRDGIRHGMRTAAFAEYAIVEQSQVVGVPDAIPLDRAAFLGCAVITGYGAVVNTAGVPAGSSVVVIGTGGVGLNAVQGAALSGAYPVVAVDVLDNKLAAAREFGATSTVNATENGAVAAAVKELTHGRGVDYAFVTVGSTEAVTQALGLVRRHGTVVIVGDPGAGATVPLPVRRLMGGELRIMGSAMGSTRLSVDVPRLVELYQGGRLKLDELITGRYPLEEINEAIESMERGEALRNVIVFPTS
jgi:Zn-dependent alcohol dehydrogenase